MVVSINSESHKDEFSALLKATIEELNNHAKASLSNLSKLKGNMLEPYVHNVMSEIAVGTTFESSIELISGQKFPDIVANRFYGVEVKSTTQNHWRTTGNSVLESTRVEDVERIFMLFGKLAAPIEFKCRPYEECLSEIVVTHSPRYLVDMNLQDGNTIFNKMNISYDNLRREPYPIKSIVNYYKSKLKPGQDMWWIDQEENVSSSSLVIDIWNSLNITNRNIIRNKAMAFFPEIFGNNGDKFSRFALWLITKEAIVCPNIRDIFTAGGRGSIVINGASYEDIPQVLLKLMSSISDIIQIINETSVDELSEYWGIKTNDSHKINDWINLVINYSSKTMQGANVDLKKMILESISSR